MVLSHWTLITAQLVQNKVILILMHIGGRNSNSNNVTTMQIQLHTNRENHLRLQSHQLLKQEKVFRPIIISLAKLSLSNNISIHDLCFMSCFEILATYF